MKLGSRLLNQRKKKVSVAMLLVIPVNFEFFVAS